MELNLEEVNIAINLVNNGEEVNMLSWDVMYHIRRGMPDSGLELDKSLREVPKIPPRSSQSRWST